MSKNEEEDVINTFKHNEKTHSTMKKKLSLCMQNTYIFWQLEQVG